MQKGFGGGFRAFGVCVRVGKVQQTLEPSTHDYARKPCEPMHLKLLGLLWGIWLDLSPVVKRVSLQRELF